jgi:3-methylcrotonyl-CoA carboxylase beta subunit
VAHIPFLPIGRSRDEFLGDRDFENNHSAMTAREAPLQAKRDAVKEGWGKKYQDRVHKKGKMTAWERVDALKDSDSPILPVGSMVNDGLEFGERSLKSPGAGVLTVFIKVHRRWCMVIANDNTVASGSWWPRTPEKIERAQNMALRLKIPVIYLVDCSGLFLPEQSQSFPGLYGAGHIFQRNSALSAAGVPQIAGVFGDCIAGGGYMPIISDRVFMTEQAYMVIAGAALIKGAKSQNISSLDIGGPEVHVHQSRCADERVPNDEICIKRIREDVEKLPGTAVDYYRGNTGAAAPAFKSDELSGLFPADHRHVYPIEEVVARLVDRSLFWEIYPEKGQEVFCGIGLVSGLPVGFLANRQGLMKDPDDPTDKGLKPMGILYREGIAKLSAFARACDDDGIPVVWLQDIAGFDVGYQAEAHGLLGYGSSLIYGNSTRQTPFMTVLLRKASGAGYYAMSGMPYEPVMQISTPITRLSVMEGRTLAIAAYNTRLDDDFNIATDDPVERKKIEDGMKAVEARIEKDMDPLVSARQLDTDEIVFMSELRNYLEAFSEMCYQTTGHRRAKNSRIWGLHDIDVLSAGKD